MKKKVTKKSKKVIFWVEVSPEVAELLTEFADADNRKRKPYVQKLLSEHVGIKKY